MNIQDTNMVQVQLGKKGISLDFVNDIKKNLAKDKLIKVKLLKSSMEGLSRKIVVDELLDKMAHLSLEYKVVGNVLFLKRIKK